MARSFRFASKNGPGPSKYGGCSIGPLREMSSPHQRPVATRSPIGEGWGGPDFTGEIDDDNSYVPGLERQQVAAGPRGAAHAGVLMPD